MFIKETSCLLKAFTSIHVLAHGNKRILTSLSHNKAQIFIKRILCNKTTSLANPIPRSYSQSQKYHNAQLTHHHQKHLKTTEDKRVNYKPQYNSNAYTNIMLCNL